MSEKGQFHFRAFPDSDAERLVGWVRSQKELLEWAGPNFSFPFSLEDFRKHLQSQPEDRFHPLCLLDSDTEQIVAYGEVNVVKADDPIAVELTRIIVDPVNARGRGIGTAFVSLLLKFCFEDLGLTRVALNVYTHNKPAVRCYEKAGFAQEGLRRQVVRCNDIYWDAYVMAILRNEWTGTI